MARRPRQRIKIAKPFGRTVEVTQEQFELAHLIVETFATGVTLTKVQIVQLAQMTSASPSRAYRLARLARDVSDEPIYAVARDQYKNLSSDPLAWDRVNRNHLNRAIGLLRAGVEYMLKLDRVVMNHPALSTDQRASLAAILEGRRLGLGSKLGEFQRALSSGDAQAGGTRPELPA